MSFPDVQLLSCFKYAKHAKMERYKCKFACYKQKPIYNNAQNN